MEVRKGRETISFDTDEHPRSTSLEALGKLRAAFKDGGSVTAGNSSGINDGAAALVVTTAAKARELGVTPRMRLVARAESGVEPSIMGSGPIPAIEKALEKAGLRVEDLDVIELNEAFAAVAAACSTALGLPADKTNPNGGAVALGHPVGATGAILTVKLMNELERTGGRYGLCRSASAAARASRQSSSDQLPAALLEDSRQAGASRPVACPVFPCRRGIGGMDRGDRSLDPGRARRRRGPRGERRRVLLRW